ncbi:MAG: aldo/keto reductase [Candidatus Dormibacteria bacterium]
MRYLEAGGKRLSVVGLGCWQFGEPGWGYGSEYGAEEAVDVIRRALELGVTVLDTAELYGRGSSERLVGRALKDWEGERFLATKFLPVVALPGTLVRHLERSLERLGVAAVDLYQLHFPNPLFPVRRQTEGLRRVLELGLTREVGVSNFSLTRWVLTERWLARPVLSNQVQYSLLHRQPERELLPYAEQHQRVILAYSPLAQGILGGRYRSGRSPAGLRRHRLIFSDAALDAAEPLLEVLREVAAGHGVTPAQVALAYLLSHPQVVAIPGAKSVAQLEANVAAAELLLTTDEVLALRRAADLFQLPRLRSVAQLPRRLRSRAAGTAA